MDYPEWARLDLDDWPDFANRCKSILFERGHISEGLYLYEDLFIRIEWRRQNARGSIFEVKRRPMPDHELDGLDEMQIVYAEVDCVCEFSHWEAGLVYTHVLKLTEYSASSQKKRARKGARR